MISSGERPAAALLATISRRRFFVTRSSPVQVEADALPPDSPRCLRLARRFRYLARTARPDGGFRIRRLPVPNGAIFQGSSLQGRRHRKRSDPLLPGPCCRALHRYIDLHSRARLPVRCPLPCTWSSQGTQGNRRAYLPRPRSSAALQSDDKNGAFRRCQEFRPFSSGVASETGKEARSQGDGVRLLRRHLARKVNMHRARGSAAASSNRRSKRSRQR